MDAMQKCLVISLALALSVAPFSARAALLGTSCDATQVGMTRMDTDRKNIIACLETGAGPATYEWKPMSGSGGDGIDCMTVITSVNTTITQCMNKASGKICYNSGDLVWVCLATTGYNIN